MIPSLSIENFRLFKQLDIEKLSRVNLFVGKNNSGKSCLLEALRVYASNAHPETLRSLIVERGEDWKIYYEAEQQTFFDRAENNPFQYLFNGYELESKSLTICSPCKPFDRSSNVIRLDFNISYHLTVDEEVVREAILEVSSPYKHYSMELDDLSLFYSNEHKHTDIKPLHLFQFVSTQPVTNKKNSILWDGISVKPSLRQEVFNALKLIDKDIFEVTLISDGTPILIYSDDKQLPLKSLGDGATHLFHIILALVNAKDGLLLIDEFENGLHYSIQPKIWKLIFTLSEHLNVQVFATTHSRDCIQGFAEAWSENKGLGTFYRLDNYKNKTKATPYDVELLDFDLNNDGEVR